MRKVLNEIIIKHLAPRSEEELSKLPKMIITDEDIAQLRKLPVSEMWNALENFSFDAKYDWLKKNRKRFEPGRSYFTTVPRILDNLIIELIRHPEINEAIKHLSPKSVEEQYEYLDEEVKYLFIEIIKKYLVKHIDENNYIIFEANSEIYKIKYENRRLRSFTVYLWTRRFENDSDSWFFQTYINNFKELEEYLNSVNEAIKHLSPKSDEEIRKELVKKYVGKYFKSRYTRTASSEPEHERKEIIKITDIEFYSSDFTSWSLIGTNIYRKNSGYKFGPIDLFDNEYQEVLPKKDKVGRTRYVNEAIKHLTPKTQEELKKYYDKLSPDEKVKEGCEHELIWLVKQGLDEGANYARALTVMGNSYSKDPHFTREIDALEFLIKERKDKLRNSLKGRRATDRLKFAHHYKIEWLEDEIEENEDHLIRQEELADEYSEYEDKNPLYIRDKIRDVFDSLREANFKIDYKIIDDKKYYFEIILTQNVYLSDEVEDIFIEDEEPIEFKIKIFLNIFDTKIDYNFYAKYKDGADIGYDEGTFTIDRKTMGKELVDHLDYLLGDVVETEYEKFKKDILDIAEKIHTESEPFDEEKYYPQLQEGIKHLSPKSEKEIGKYLNTSKNIEEYIHSNIPRASVNVSFDLKNISFETRWYTKINEIDQLDDDIYLETRFKGNFDLRINYFFYKIETEINALDEENFLNDFQCSDNMSILKQLYEWRFMEEKSEKLPELKGKGFKEKIKYITNQITNKKLSEKYDPLILDDFEHYMEMFGKKEEYDDSMYYPQLQEGIKHLSGRSIKEVEKNNKETLRLARKYILGTRLSKKIINVSEIIDNEFTFEVETKDYKYTEKSDLEFYEYAKFRVYIQRNELFISAHQYKKHRYYNRFNNIDDFKKQIEHALTLL